MKTEYFPDLNPTDLFRKVDIKNESPFFSWRTHERGWRKILAVNPVESFILHDIKQMKSLKRFISAHKDKLVTGYLSYELGHSLHGLDNRFRGTDQIPLALFHAYNNFIEFTDNHSVVYCSSEQFLDYIRSLNNRVSKPLTNISIDFQQSLSASDYEQKLDTILNYIRAGDIYQVNFTHQLHAQSNHSASDIFCHFLSKNPVDYAAFMGNKDFSLHSLSPERFVQIKNGSIFTEPIKGTRPKGDTNAATDEYIKELLTDEKEQAELYMIIDLLRNDIGKISQIGSVKVVHEKGVLELEELIHTFGRIEGTLKPELHSFDALLSMLPGGSISGCPKRRSLEIINELEDQPRGIYTGAIGYIFPDGELDFNIAIRTVLQKGNKLTLGVGGGITINSKINTEILESLLKAKTFMGNSNHADFV